jgi:hypothetical protein
MKIKQALPVAVVALVLGGVAAALVLPTAIGTNDGPALASKQAGWTEVQWPFPLDQFGRGKAFRCSGSECGTTVTLYVRAKIGFCNCMTGVADDAELERIGDLELLGAKATPVNDGRPITVAWMKGRSRAYAIDNKEPNKEPRQAALSIGYNDRCDAIVATAVLPHGRPGDAEAAVLQFLNGPTVMRWAELALGL